MTIQSSRAAQRGGVALAVAGLGVPLKTHPSGQCRLVGSPRGCASRPSCDPMGALSCLGRKSPVWAGRLRIEKRRWACGPDDAGPLWRPRCRRGTLDRSRLRQLFGLTLLNRGDRAPRRGRRAELGGRWYADDRRVLRRPAADHEAGCCGSDQQSPNGGGPSNPPHLPPRRLGGSPPRSCLGAPGATLRVPPGV